MVLSLASFLKEREIQIRKNFWFVCNIISQHFQKQNKNLFDNWYAIAIRHGYTSWLYVGKWTLNTNRKAIQSLKNVNTLLSFKQYLLLSIIVNLQKNTVNTYICLYLGWKLISTSHSILITIFYTEIFAKTNS